jgi:hypothetical protein
MVTGGNKARLVRFGRNEVGVGSQRNFPKPQVPSLPAIIRRRAPRASRHAWSILAMPRALITFRSCVEIYGKAETRGLGTEVSESPFTPSASRRARGLEKRATKMARRVRS